MRRSTVPMRTSPAERRINAYVAWQRDCEAVELISNVEDEGVRALVAPFGFELTGGILRLQLQRR